MWRCKTSFSNKKEFTWHKNDPSRLLVFLHYLQWGYAAKWAVKLEEILYFRLFSLVGLDLSTLTAGGFTAAPAAINRLFQTTHFADVIENMPWLCLRKTPFKACFIPRICVALFRRLYCLLLSVLLTVLFAKGIFLLELVMTGTKSVTSVLY